MKAVVRLSLLAGMDASPRKGGATGGNEFGTAGSGGNRGIGNANSPSTNALRELLGVTEDGGVGARDGDAGMGVGGEVGDVDHGVLGIVQVRGACKCVFVCDMFSRSFLRGDETSRAE